MSASCRDLLGVRGWGGRGGREQLEAGAGGSGGRVLTGPHCQVWGLVSRVCSGGLLEALASEKGLKYVGQEETWGWWPGLGFSVQVVRGSRFGRVKSDHQQEGRCEREQEPRAAVVLGLCSPIDAMY